MNEHIPQSELQKREDQKRQMKEALEYDIYQNVILEQLIVFKNIIDGR